jgi:hypothetical protein
LVQRKTFASGGTEAFLEGHVHAFTTLGGVPTGKIRYDTCGLQSPKSSALWALTRFPRRRVETARWTWK